MDQSGLMFLTKACVVSAFSYLMFCDVPPFKKKTKQKTTLSIIADAFS